MPIIIIIIMSSFLLFGRIHDKRVAVNNIKHTVNDKFQLIISLFMIGK
jgi:hypothetical protein